MKNDLKDAGLMREVVLAAESAQTTAVFTWVVNEDARSLCL